MTRLSFVTIIYFAFASCRSSSDSPDDMARRFIATNQIRGMFVAVVRGDSILYQNSFAKTNEKIGTVVSDTTCMELGSVSKAFTAEVIYQLQNENLLSLDDSITRYLPGAPGNWASIKIRHLLTHTSGIQNYLLDPRFKAREYFSGVADSISEHFFRTVSTDSMTHMFYSLPVEFMPGSSWGYSNTGYYLLGKIAESVTGVTFFDLVKDRVTEPFNMYQTMANELALQKGCLTAGYFHSDTGFVQAHTLTSNYAFSAGAWATSGHDMINYLKAIHRKALPSDMVKFNRESLLNHGLPFAYEGGRFYTTYHGNKIMAHNGGTPGFSSSWIHVVDKSTSIIVLMNRQDYAAIDQFAWDILSYFEPSLKYPTEQLEGDEEKDYSRKVMDIVNALRTNEAYPKGFSKPLQIFMNSENGKGMWRWLFERGFPETAYCVDVEKMGELKAYRYRLPLSRKVEYRMTMLLNGKSEIVQLRWW